ncbi:Protein of unknown function, putative, partial [Plasmodium vivax]
CLNNNILNNAYMSEDRVGIRTDRLLAKYELGIKNERSILLDKTSDYRNNSRMPKEAENMSKYNMIGKNVLNNFEYYRKNYEKRYNKKKGIAKLECYCEKKVFDNLDYICSLEEKIKSGKKRLKNILYKNYGLPIVLFLLFSLLGLIIPILDEYHNIHKMMSCGISSSKPEDHEKCKTIVMCILGSNIAFFMTFVIILLFVFIYIFLKTLKYKRLKEGRIKIKN